jgi:hypothetical protein
MQFQVRIDVKYNRMKNIFLIFLLTLFIPSVQAQGQANDTLRKDALKVYIDCYCSCDQEYFRKEITFVNYVRETKEAELYILITSKNTGSGGNEYSFFFNGQGHFSSMADTLKMTSNFNSTSDEIREMMLQTLKLGLMRYVARTPVGQNMKVSLKNEEEIKEQIVEDRWKSWVFSANNSVYLNGQKSYQSFNLTGSFYATRITPDWKLRFNLNASYYEQKFDIGEEIVTSYSRSYSFYHMLVRSLSDHWSIGGTFNAAHSTYSNQNIGGWLTPAVEYDVFPYSQSTRRQLYIFYKIGPEYNNYIDTTIYNKTKELLFFHRFSVSYNIIQKWGSVSTSFYASNYLHDFSKYNISLYSSLSVRIVKGLSFTMYGQYALIHDQLSLPKSGATNEEILLQQKELSTQFSYYLSTGLSYTFGSIYNNVVNPRFGE